jgi:hypothetical protein
MQFEQVSDHNPFSSSSENLLRGVHPQILPNPIIGNPFSKNLNVAIIINSTEAFNISMPLLLRLSLSRHAKLSMRPI